MSATYTANWSYPTAIRFGVGRVNEVGDVCSERGLRPPLLLTDTGLVDLPPVHAVLESLGGVVDHVDTFSGVDANPVGQNITDGVAAFAEGRHDCVVAVGGGSALDAGKLIAFMSGQRRPIWDFEDIGDNWKLAEPGGAAPIIAVPTTAGTGSEVGRAGVVIDEAARRKVIVFHPDVLPVEVIADPALTLELPTGLTVGTGMDALSHSLEAYFATAYHPMADGIATEGARLAFANLRTVVDEPHNLEARSAMLAAALMGAVAFQKGLGAMHALAHPIGAVFGTHHGMTNAVLMPYVLAANWAYIAPRAQRLGRAIGIDPGPSGLIDAVLELRAAIGVPHTLVELGVDAAEADRIAAAAVIDPSAGGNARA
ncbi:MAG: iron-containing alcohol dehydrogenase, partial [Acidimicrobiales bacterium]